MARFQLNDFTKEQLVAAAKCKSAAELVALAKKGGLDISEKEAEAYLLELKDYELGADELNAVAGGDGGVNPNVCRYYGAPETYLDVDW